jgi:predicted AlkP superfamily phosphohydrolase/phosphomutase
MQPRLIVLGLDGISPGVLERSLSQGRLPNIKRMMDKGVVADLETTVPSVTYLAIPSLCTGCKPGTLGFFGFVSPDGEPLDYSSMGRKSFWEYGSLRSLVVNLRCTYKPRPFNGVMVAGDLLNPGEHAEYTFPPNIKNRVKGFHSGMGQIERLHRQGSTGGQVLEFAKRDTEKKLSIFLELIDEDEYDLGLFWDGNLDLVQHFLWEETSLVDEYYAFLDEKLGHLLGQFGSSDLIVVSDHGFDTEPVFSFHLNSWLERQGHLVIGGSRAFKWLLRSVQPISYDVHERNRLAAKLIRKALEVSRGKRRYVGAVPGADMEKTVAYLVAWWGIGLNIDAARSRDERGLAETIIAQLGEVTHGSSRVFQGIWTQEEVYGKGNLPGVPRLVFSTDPRYKCVPSLSSALVSVRRPSLRRGNHLNSRQTLLLAAGPSFREGGALGKVSICDIAPTILHTLGLPVPADMDGRVLRESFREGSAPATRDVTLQGVDPERERLERRLRRLKNTSRL